MGVKLKYCIFCNLIIASALAAYLPYCMSQELAYFSNQTDHEPVVDSEPETSIEDVAVVETEPVNEITAIAKIYEITNVTDSEDKSAKSTKVACLNTTNDSDVEIFNTTGLMNALYINPDVKKRSTPSNCTIVMFYARWCPFSANAAPHFNALPRVFPALKVAAIDATVHSSVNTYFGILSVPTIMLFHNGKLVAKYNESVISLAKISDFITSITDLEVAEKLNVTSQDFHGPLPSVPSKDRDLYLYLAWVFVIVCFLNYARRSVIVKTAIEFVRVTWREAEDQHEHQE
jgi:thiol-disulfide isomerase/thioredoxin